MVQCGNCERIEDEWYQFWKCPECEDWICCGSDVGCRQHEKLRPGLNLGGTMMVCADCCDSTCWCEVECDDCGEAEHSCSCDDDDDDYCDDCGEEWDDCECDDDDEDD